MQAGDFILTHNNSLVGRIIRFGQHIRYRGDKKKYAWTNHAALIVSDEGDLVEALGRGVTRSHISKYKPADYEYVDVQASDEDRKQIVAFGEHCVGDKYGFFTILCIALGLLTGTKITFGYAGQCICSGLVARAQERAGQIFEREPEDVMPADLAAHYGVTA